MNAPSKAPCTTAPPTTPRALSTGRAQVHPLICLSVFVNNPVSSVGIISKKTYPVHAPLHCHVGPSPPPRHGDPPADHKPLRHAAVPKKQLRAEQCVSVRRLLPGPRRRHLLPSSLGTGGAGSHTHAVHREHPQRPPVLTHTFSKDFVCFTDILNFDCVLTPLSLFILSCPLQGVCVARSRAARGHSHAAASLPLRPGQCGCLSAAPVLRGQQDQGGGEVREHAGRLCG